MRHKKLIIFLCIIFGLAAGFGAGFLLQRELKNRKADSTARKAAQTEPVAVDSAPEQSVPESAPPVQTAPPATASTPKQAMLDYMATNGIDSTGMSFSVVSQSATDSDWKVDKAARSGGTAHYFLLHNVTGGWAVVAYGGDLTADQLAAAGAPSDLTPP